MWFNIVSSRIQSAHLIVYQGNVLLDSEIHCQITDFGLTRCSKATVAWTTKTFVAHYAAPELFGMCCVCSKMGCDGCHPEHRTTKTLETDVYAFGCLYYEVRLKCSVLVFSSTLNYVTCTDILWCRSFSGENPISHYGMRHKWSASRAITKSKNWRQDMETHQELLDDQAFEASDNGSNSGDNDSIWVRPELGFITGRRILLLFHVFVKCDVYNCYNGSLNAEVRRMPYFLNSFQNDCISKPGNCYGAAWSAPGVCWCV